VPRPVGSAAPTHLVDPSSPVCDSRGRTFRLALLRGFELSVNGLFTPLSSGPQHLLAYLALNGKAMRRTQVAGTLWGDVSDRRAAANLRSMLWRLRRLDLDLVGTSNEYVSLSKGVVVDIHEMGRIAERIFAPSMDVTELSLEELPFTGELLPGWGDEWVVLERERLRQISLHVLEALCERWVGEGLYEKAVGAGLAAVASEPLRESSHRVLIRAFLAEGNPTEAIRRYRMYRETLQRELNLTPSTHLTELVANLAKR